MEVSAAALLIFRIADYKKMLWPSVAISSSRKYPGSASPPIANETLARSLTAVSSR
jgi:hypothetical protein